jgi:hypothetical protein
MKDEKQALLSKLHDLDKSTKLKKSASSLVSPDSKSRWSSGSVHSGRGRSFPLPGGQDHPILSYSDEEFASTPVSKMLEAYPGPTLGGDTCEMDFGKELVSRWRKTKKPYCRYSLLQGGRIGGSTSNIDCYLVRQTRHGGNGDNLCLMKNVAVNMQIFGDSELMYDVVKAYVSSKHRYQPYVKFPRGFVRGACSPDPELWKPDYMPGWNNDWTTGAFEEVKSDNVNCDLWVEEPVIVDQRDTFANFFHDSEDFINMFLAMSILEWSLKNTQIYLTDLYPKGPFW